MKNLVDVTFTPADFGALAGRKLDQACCVVLDVLRATTSMVTALTNGAESILPVAEISEALALRQRDPGVLLAGERDGLRIGPSLTGGIAFDLGNSPREFTRAAVAGRTVVMTTTNGTRALRSVMHARVALVCSFLNLRATADAVRALGCPELLIVCSGTFEQAAYEDVLGAGALLDSLQQDLNPAAFADSARIALKLYRLAKDGLAGALAESRNGLRLLSRPELHEDVSYCAQRDTTTLVARLDRAGAVRPGLGRP